MRVNLSFICFALCFQFFQYTFAVKVFALLRLCECARYCNYKETLGVKEEVKNIHIFVVLYLRDEFTHTRIRGFWVSLDD